MGAATRGGKSRKPDPIDIPVSTPGTIVFISVSGNRGVAEPQARPKKANIGDGRFQPRHLKRPHPLIHKPCLDHTCVGIRLLALTQGHQARLVGGKRLGMGRARLQTTPVSVHRRGKVRACPFFDVQSFAVLMEQRFPPGKQTIPGQPGLNFVVPSF